MSQYVIKLPAQRCCAMNGSGIRSYSYNTLLPGLALLFYVLTGTGCAVPVTPAGGPPDEDPPTIESTEPADGAVNQGVDRISFRFDERIDERSIAQALSIVPDFDRPPEIRFRGRRVDIIFPEPLRENTTYIITLDTGLRDAHSVALKQPITVAFGTGPTLNQGRMRGRVVSQADGQPQSGIDVFAYAASEAANYSPGHRPDYRTQTDDQGNFSLSYLREQSYFVLAVQDRNGNREADPGEPSAVPPHPLLEADSVGAVIDRPWVLADIDSEPPTLRQVRARSSREHELRFSEQVVLRDTVTSNWALIDSASGLRQEIELMYAGTNSRVVVLRTRSLSNRIHFLSGYAAISDSSGNAMEVDTLSFLPSQEPFENAPAFLGYHPDSLSADISGTYRIWPGIRAGLRFTAPPGDNWDALVTVTDTSGAPLSYNATTRDGVLYTLFGSELSQPAEISVRDRDSTYSRVFIAADPAVLGELSGFVTTSGSDTSLIVELIRDDSPARFSYRTRADASGRFRFTGLPGQTRYLIRAFVDEDGNGVWSPGRVFPFAGSEPIAWKAVQEPVRARWDTALPDTVRINAE